MQPGRNPSGGAFPHDEGLSFRVGSIVLLTLLSPREKFWGALCAVNVAGVCLCGIPLESFDDFVSQVREQESPASSTVFFPMHRVEKMELDLPGGGVPSLSERFEQKTGIAPTQFFAGEVNS